MPDPRWAGFTANQTFRVAVSLLPVLLITLVPVGSSTPDLEDAIRICRACGSQEASDGLLNLLLFAPFGWVLGRRWGVLQALGFGLVVSIGIEGAQVFIPGRFASAADLLANSLGAGFGAWVSAQSRLPTGVFAVGVLAALVAPVIFLRPAPPTESVYYGQWMASLGEMEVYRGEILDAVVGEVLIPPGRSEQTEELRLALIAGAPLWVRMEAGPPPRGEAPILSIFDSDQQEIFMLGADGNDIFIRLWRLGTTARFQTPTWWWDGALNGVTTGDTVQITYLLGHRAPCLKVRDRSHCLAATRTIGGWSLLAPDERGSLLVSVAGLLWAFLLGAPFGMLSLSFRGKVLLTSGIGTGLAAVSMSVPYWVTPWWGILLMFSGMMAASLMEPWIRKMLEA